MGDVFRCREGDAFSYHPIFYEVTSKGPAVTYLGEEEGDFACGVDDPCIKGDLSGPRLLEEVLIFQGRGEALKEVSGGVHEVYGTWRLNLCQRIVLSPSFQ